MGNPAPPRYAHIPAYSARVSWTPEQIRRQRLLRGWGQDEAAEALGVSRRSIQTWEAGLSRPQGRNADALDRVFGQPPTGVTLSEATDAEVMVEQARRLAELRAEVARLRAQIARPAGGGGREISDEGQGGLPTRDLEWPRRNNPDNAPHHGHSDSGA